MKKLIIVIMTLATILALIPASILTVTAIKIGDELGNVLNTDIKVYINNHQIPAYAVNNKMAIIMENLAKYGFEVKYDNKERTLKAVRNFAKEFTPIENIEANTKKPGSIAFPYVYTDIKAYLNGKEVECFAINGNMCIYFEDLKDYGKFVWNTQTRCSYLTYFPPKEPGKFDFGFAWFDSIGELGVQKAIPNVVMRFFGKFNNINPGDFTDLALMRDGKPVDNKLKYNGESKQFEWAYKDCTDFYFIFEKENTQPGIYYFTGKYKGVEFESVQLVIEKFPIGNKPANPDDLMEVHYTFFADKNDNIIKISEVFFRFDGKQEAFNIADLTELKLTLNGKAIDFAFQDVVFRYLDVGGKDLYSTKFNLLFKEELVSPGTYKLTGKYRGVAFESVEITVVKK